MKLGFVYSGTHCISLGSRKNEQIMDDAVDAYHNLPLVAKVEDKYIIF